MLGMCVSSSDERCTTDKERKREACALQVAAKRRYLHPNVAKTAYICGLAVTSKVSWAWYQKAPPDTMLGVLLLIFTKCPR